MPRTPRVAAGAQDVQPALAVGDQGVEGVAVAGDLARREVHHRLGALGTGRGQRARVEDRALRPAGTRVRRDGLEVREAAVGEVVDALHLVAARQQALRRGSSR